MIMIIFVINVYINIIMILLLKAEKNTLADALRESEAEVRRLRGELSGREDVVRRLEEQTSLLVRRAEQRSQELQSARYFLLPPFLPVHLPSPSFSY